MKNSGYGQRLCWSVLTKTALIMKIWLLLMIPVGITVAGEVHAQRLSIALKDVTIREALHAVERESGYSFFYNDDFEDLSRKVTINAKDELLSDVISVMLSGTSLTYKFLEGKLIVIVLKETPQMRVQG